MEEKLERIIKWSNGKKEGPLSLEIWPTNRCNSRCLMCGTWASRRREGITYDPDKERERELSDEILLKVVDDAVKLGVKEFILTGGGEPLVRKDTILKLMKEIKKSGACGRLNTNGTLFLPRDISKIVAMGWDTIVFSMDGPDAETHDFIRNVDGTFEKVRNVIIELKNQKKKLGVDKPRISFNTVLMSKNFEKIPKLVEFASEMSCENITFIPLIAFDKSLEKYKLSLTQRLKLKKMIFEIKKISEELKVHTNIHEFEEKSIVDTSKMDEVIESEIESLPSGFSSVPCYEPFLHLLITPDGMTTCCCMLAGKGIKGDFLAKGLRDIWFSEWFNNLREQFLRKELPEECGTCVFQQFIRNREIREKLKTL